MSRYTAKQYATALFDALADAKAGERDSVVRRFAQTVVKNYDRAQLPKIMMQLKKLERAKAGRHEVVLTSARPLTREIVSEIKHKVGNSSGITEIVDPEVLGGLKVLINDELVIDGTYKTRVARLVEAVAKASA